MITFSAEVVLGGRVITYSAEAKTKAEFINLVKSKVAKKYPKYSEGLMIRQIRELGAV